VIQAKLNIQQSNDLNKAIASSCRMLALREHCEKQLRLKLQKKAFEKTVISACIHFLQEENWLSEERFCNAFIRSRAEKGHGLQRIQYELAQQDINTDIIQRQLDAEDIDWQFVCDRVLHKKISTNGFGIQKNAIGQESRKQQRHQFLAKDRKRIESFLAYRGFSFDEIKKAFGQLGTSELRSSNK
jgi:regulatory protein